jgi:multicomponent Na+:H+ antiporter subunit A
VDGLAIFFGLIITVIGAAIALYTGYYFEGEPRQGYFYSMLFLFMASMLGLVWADNLLALYVFWEGTSITSYLLIAFNDRDKAAQDGARRAFLVTGIGGLAMLLGMVLLGTSAETYSISELLMTPGLTSMPVASAAIILILLGAFTKSAQFPFHFWLPGAMSAPTPASAYLHSATMVKAGVYLLARLHPALSDHPIWFWGLLLIGGTTMMVGAVVAVGQYDLKALLAYATVSQLGVFVMLLAFPDQSAHTALIVGILAHALYKGSLFMVAGIIDHATGTRDVRRLANLSRHLPLVTVAALGAGLSMAGLPPMFGFVAKELLLENFVHVSEATPGIGWAGEFFAVTAAAFTVTAAFTLLWEVFFRREAEASHPVHIHHTPSLFFVLPPLFLVLLNLAIPFFLEPLGGLLFAPAISAVSATAADVHLALWHGFNLILTFSIIAILLGAVLFAARAPLRRLLSKLPNALDGARVWEQVIQRTYDLATWVTLNIQGVSLLQQARNILITGVVAMIFALISARWNIDFPIDWTVMPYAHEVIIAVLTIFAAIITVNADSRLGAIISLGAVGITITLFFVFHSAPDLAFTQLLVDILTVVLLILVFYRMPPTQVIALPIRLERRNIVLSAFVGFLGFFFVLFSVSQPLYPVIGDYFSLNAVPLGHGGNIVNVILVDFRAFDTFGEITVLAIAAIGGYAVLRAALFRFRPISPDTETNPGHNPEVEPQQIEVQPMRVEE